MAMNDRKKAGDDKQPMARTLLVVDDEEDVLRFVETALTTLGYAVIAADGGKQAIGIYHNQCAQIDGVILDYLMPETDGLDVFREMKSINPEVKVLLLTGYGYRDDLQRIKHLGVKDIVFKPVRLEVLAEKVAELLG